MKVRKFLKSLAIAATLLGTISSASAAVYDLGASTFDGFTITSQITTSDTLNAVGAFDVLSIQGTVFNGADTFNITGLENNPGQPYATTSASGMYYFDNDYFANSAAPFDNAGLLFTFGDAGYEGNFYQANSGIGMAFVTTAALASLDASWNTERAMSSWTVAAVPEPGEYAMMLAGLGMMAFVARRRKLSGIGC